MAYVRKIINDPVYGFITSMTRSFSTSSPIPITSGCGGSTRWPLLRWCIPVPCIPACITRWALIT
jgi:hypothetical protein